MDIELLLLKAQLKALRSHYMYFISNHPKKDEWLNKYLLWTFEREHLPLSYDEAAQPSSPGSDDNASEQYQMMIDRRRYQLQVLCDIACIVGNLDMDRLIDPESRRIALDVYNRSDGSEEGMIPLIDEYY